MKALRFSRSLPRFAAARVAGSLQPGGGARVGPLALVEAPDPVEPGPGWEAVRPILAGICGSDLATVAGKSSRYFEPIVSFPFVPGHEIVGTTADGARVVVEPVLGCAARDVTPPCPACAGGSLGRCEHLTLGHLKPGLQTGYCADTGGGWSTALVAHASQLHRVPEAFSDEAAVMVEPAACAVHAAFRARVPGGGEAGQRPGEPQRFHGSALTAGPPWAATVAGRPRPATSARRASPAGGRWWPASARG